MAINSQLSAIESKKQTRQTTRTGTESQMWRSLGGLSVWKGKRENGEKVQGIRSTSWQVQNRQEDIKKGIGNGEAKALTCMTHGHEQRGVYCWRKGRYQVEGGKGGKIGQL